MKLHDLAIIHAFSPLRGKRDFSSFIAAELDETIQDTPENRVYWISQYLKKEASRETIGASILQIESDLLPILAKMEETGVLLDEKRLHIIGERIRADIRVLEAEIYELVGEHFNINSPKQIQGILFDKLKIVPKKKNKTGYSVDNEVLEEIAEEYTIARLILEYRTLSKLDSTYIVGLLKSINPITKRIHTTYDSLGAATGRMSSNDPNLQNIPAGDGYAREIKECFIPSTGNIFLVADYSQVELRVLAFLSQDEHLLDAFEKGEDIHTRTARFLFANTSLGREVPTKEAEGAVSRKNPLVTVRNEAVQVSEKQSTGLPRSAIASLAMTDTWKPTPEQRRIAKTVNFGVIYGITGFGLSKTLDCSPYEANRYIEAFYAKYPKVREYYDGVLAEAREKGYVETYFGRRRYIHSINDANKTIRSIAEREAMNMPIQGTAADMIKLAMIDISANIRDSGIRGSMILQVHDELVFDIPESEGEIFENIVRASMEGVLTKHLHETSLRIPPILVDISTGRNWAEAK